MTRPACILLVAAEASGDRLGADLAEALRRRLGDGVRFVGVGGERMRRAGVDSPFPIADLSVLGLVEGLLAYPRVRRRARETAALAGRERIDIAVLIDSWGFTLRVAQRLRRLMPAVPIVKYVGPQVWASRPGRARTLALVADRLLTVHAFDAPFFEAAGLKTTFVGNSSLALDVSGVDALRGRRRIGAEPGARILLVLPGSRPAEVRRMLAPMRDAVARLVRDRPDLRIVIPVASTVAERVRAGVAGWPGAPVLIDDEAEKLDLMAAATAALACSGSVTTELALAGCPMVVGYRLGWLTHLILQRLITTDRICLLNIAADAERVPERVQSACTGAALAAAVAPWLDDANLRARQVAAQATALNRLGRGQPGAPAELAADAVLDVLTSGQAPG